MLHPHFHIPVSSLVRRRSCAVWLPRENRKLRLCGPEIQPSGSSPLRGVWAESGQNFSCSGIPPSFIQHNPSNELRTSLQRDSLQSQYKCAHRVKREYTQEKTQHVRSRNGTNIFPGRLYYSFHNPLYEAKVTQHMGSELGTLDPVRIMSIVSIYYLFDWGPVISSLWASSVEWRYSCAHSSSRVVWIKWNKTCKELTWHVINAQ